MKRKNGLDEVRQSTRTYGDYVNSKRALPNIKDGLKQVQRRLLLAASDVGCRTGLEHSPAIAGTCTARYNPHAESSAYDTMVRMANADVPLFRGKGNFGSRGFNPQGAAAMRYTSARLTDIAEMFLENVKFVEHYTNDLGNSEPDYLPTPVPYALLNGAQGIGVGCGTNIPRISPQSLYAVAKQLLEGKEFENVTRWLHPQSCGGGYIDIDEDNLSTLNFYGYGRAKLRAEVYIEYSEIDGKDVIVVENAPQNLSYTRLLAKLRDLMEDGLVSLRDEGNRVVIIRAPRVRKITEEELLEICQKAMSRTVSFRVIVSDNGVARMVGLYEWLNLTLQTCRDAYVLKNEEVLRKLNLEATFLRVRKELAALLLEDASNEKIKKALSISDDELDYCLKKSVGQLSRTRNTDDRVQKEIAQIEAKLENVNHFLDKDVLKRLKAFA